MQYAHEIELQVRDYECDQQAVVNNAVYQNYLEHARHEFLRSRGIDFAEVTASGTTVATCWASNPMVRPAGPVHSATVRLWCRQTLADGTWVTTWSDCTFNSIASGSAGRASEINRWSA